MRFLDKGKITCINSGEQAIGWLTHSSLEEVLTEDLIFKFKEGANVDDSWANYECHDDYDLFFLNTPTELKDRDSLPNLGVYISKDEVICVYTHWEDSSKEFIKPILTTGVTKKASTKRAMLSIIDFITKTDYVILGKIEDKITTLEEDVTETSDSEIKVSIAEISRIRRQLQPMKQMYEELMDALEDLAENESDFYTENDLKYCTRIYNRVERLYKTVINLRDYVTQVREAYQAQIDIGLNNIMKFFTVLSAVFMPLTLLAGWYGMNLIMPEFGWNYGYLFVGGLSLLIIAGCLGYFKYKKWF